MTTCRVRQKARVKRQAAGIRRAENTAENMLAFLSKIGISVTRNAELLLRAAMTLNTVNGAHSSSNVIRFVRSRRFAVALPNQLKPITSFQLAQAARALTSQTDKEPAKPITLGRRRQKTPISLDTKRWGEVNPCKFKALKPPSYLQTHRREIEKIVKLPLSPMESTIK